MTITEKEIINLQFSLDKVIFSKEFQDLRAKEYIIDPYENQYEFLYLLTRLVKPKIVVELGTYKGLSMLAMMEGYPDADFYTIDINPKAGEFLKNKKVKVIIGDSARCSNQIPNDIDILLEDTDHEYDTLWREYRAFFPKMKQNGIMVFDDMNCKVYPGAKEWWNRFDAPNLPQLGVFNKFNLPELHIGYGMTAIIKK